MALVNPNIAMSYRPTVEYQPRNALAEAAQIQQIMGGQRQAEMADMQMEALRRKDRAISQIQAAAAKNGGPTDRREIAKAYVQSGVPEFMQFGLTLEKDLDELDAFARIMGGGARSATGGGAQPAARGTTPTFPIAGKDVPMGTMGTGTFDTAQIGNIGLVAPQQPPVSAEDRAALVAAAGPSGLANALRQPSQGPYTGLTLEQNRAYFQAPLEERAALERALPSMKIPGVFAGQVPPFSQLSRDLLSPETRASQDLGYGPAAQANALALTAPPENVNQLAAAGGAAATAAPSADPVAALRTRRDQLIALGTPRALQAAKSLDADIALMSKRITASPGSVVYDASGNVVATAPAAPVTPRVEIIGVAKGTDTPVYVDKNTDAQFKIGVDASGKQVRVPYTGAVNRATSTVTAPVDVRVNAYVPASEKAQSEFMAESRATFNALKNAQPTLDNIEKAKRLIPGAQGFMGPGGQPFLAAASFLNNRLGTAIDTKGVTDAEELRSRLFFGILDNLKKLDSQPTKTQQDALQQALGSIGTDPSALPRVLDAFGDSIRTKVDLYNQEVTDAETRGVKFPYRPQIRITPRPPSPGETAAQIPAGAPTRAPATSAGNTVTLPNGSVMTFPNAEAAASYRKAAGL
jgi:hypothetical protein